MLLDNNRIIIKNKLSQEIGKLMQAKDIEGANKIKEQVAEKYFGS